MSIERTVHGMEGTLVGPDWPSLTFDELRHLLKSYPDCGDPVGILFTSPRPLSAAAVVNSARGTFFVKRHAHAVRDGAGLREEHLFIEYLRSRGAPVPRVLRSAAGDSVVEAAGWTYEVHEVARGRDVYADVISWEPFRCAEHAREAGRMLAYLHRAAEGYDAPKRKVQPLVTSSSIFAGADAAAGLKKYLSERPAIAEHDGVKRCANEAIEILAPYHGEMQPLLGHLTPLWTHNDLHASNLMWSDDAETAQATAVVDFGLADRTNAVHDLATAMERNIVGWLELVRFPDRPDDVPVHMDHLCALLEGYEAVRPLAFEEAAALAPMLALCHVEFALTEADYYLGVLRQEKNARLAYEGYLVGHSRWFASRRGANLLDALRRWAADGETRGSKEARA